ncbi:hypothetical protein M434DRAFT_396309 [Hypoxylon sp. CO27-5]|nr:hypothetical protein M434DRAFT_396309 [Hypoxylon sp. CO27-5]
MSPLGIDPEAILALLLGFVPVIEIFYKPLLSGPSPRANKHVGSEMSDQEFHGV